MTFTNDELQRLRKDVEMALSCNGQIFLKSDKLEALLVRLEFAEAQRDVFKEMCDRKQLRLEAAETVLNELPTKIRNLNVRFDGRYGQFEGEKFGILRCYHTVQEELEAWRKAKGE